jgi:flagellar hook-associated protein 2
VSDVIANTTLTLTNADPTVTNVVTVGRSEDQAQQAVQSFVDAYNKVIDFIQQQQTVTQPTDGSTATPPPLYNDSVLRLARSTLSESMLTTVFGAATDMSTIDASGISLTKDGHLQFSTDTFQNAFNTRFTDLQDLFMEEGTTTNSSMIYASSTASTTPGTYDVNVTQAASRAQVLGTGFSGTYQDDGTPDTMTVTDPATNYSTQIQLTNGMTTADIVSALNTQFATGQNQTITTANVLNDASGTTAATTGTKLVDLHDASGASSGVAIGDTIDLSGLGSDGSAYSASVTVDANTTIGDLTSRLQTAVGAGATVNFTNGQFVVTSNTAGTSSLSLSLTAHNEGGGSLDFGTGNVTTTGRGIMSITASSVNGQLQIQHNSYGSAPGLTIAFSGGGTDSTAQLGLSATTVHGTDVAGTIGGFPATGNGQILVGNSGTAVDGLSLSYTAAATGDVGNITLSEGVGAIVDRLVNSWTDSTSGLLTTKQTALQNQIATQQQRLDDFNARIAIQKNTLLQKYQAMDTAVAQLQSQGNAFLAALGSASSAASASAQ